LSTHRTFWDDVVVTDMIGYTVEASDGSIGEVDDAADLAARYFAVKTGPWIFGRRVIVPLTMVDRVDSDSRKVFVSRTKDEIKNAPEYDHTSAQERDYRKLDRYYGSPADDYSRRSRR
jgi:PRC-barrel domain